MTIYFTGHLVLNGTGSPDTVLLASTPSAGVYILEDQSPGMGGAYQEVEYVRGPGRKIFYRGQERTTFRFQVLRTFADLRAAELFILDHRRLVPKKGYAQIRTEALNGADASRFIPDCSCTMEHRQLGCMVITTYTLEGGPVSTSLS